MTEKVKPQKKKIPRWLWDKEGNAYEMILENHRDGFNLVTYRQTYEDFEED